MASFIVKNAKQKFIYVVNSVWGDRCFGENHENLFFKREFFNETLKITPKLQKSTAVKQN